MRDRFIGEGTVNKCKNKIAILSSFFLSMGAIAIEDPLKGLHHISPHDDLLFNTNYYNYTENTFHPRIGQHEVLSKDKGGVNEGFDKKSVPLSALSSKFKTPLSSEVLSARLFATATDTTVELSPNADGRSFSVAVYDKKLQKNVNHTPFIKKALPDVKSQDNNPINHYYAVKADFIGAGTEPRSST